MKPTLSYLRSLFFVKYRLTYYVGGHPKNIYGNRRKAMMGRLCDIRRIGLWTLYKTGPFGLPERAVDWGEGRPADIEN
jgi:hypothetical protein